MVDIRDVFPLLSRLLQRQRSVTGSDFLLKLSVLSSGVEMQPQKEQNGGKVLILKGWPAARSIFTTKFNFLALWKLLMNEAALRAEKSLYKIYFFQFSCYIKKSTHFKLRTLPPTLQFRSLRLFPLSCSLSCPAAVISSSLPLPFLPLSFA